MSEDKKTETHVPDPAQQDQDIKSHAEDDIQNAGLPVLPLRDIVVFPNMIVPLFVGREKSVRALEEVMGADKKILLLAQKSSTDDDPGLEDIYRLGTQASVLQLLKLPDGTMKVLVEGEKRLRVLSFSDRTDFFEALVEPVEQDDDVSSESRALMRTVAEQFQKYAKLNKKISADVANAIVKAEHPSLLADSIAAHLAISLEEKQSLLEISDAKERLEHVFSLIEEEMNVLHVEKKIRSRVKDQMEKTQREYYLNEQMKAIQKELGGSEGSQDELGDLEAKIRKAKLPKEARKKAQNELKKLRQMSPMSAESTVVRNYLDWILSVPWKKTKRLQHDLDKAEAILNEDHYGLEKVKERILEYLAVQARAGSLKGPILCLVGPPGVGKTSLGKSVAKATGRDFVRISLGGVRDEAEIRGHRRTYVGSMPGRIIQSMKKTKYVNPLFLLDEIDKMGSDFRGDPSAALLEVLDPEQNTTFNDHYLEVDYDLSKTMFITTANSLNMAQPLLDRMEIISLSGYTEDEKLEIARRHLIPKQMKEHGLTREEWFLTDQALRDLIRYYTREAGVRNLEREIARLARKAVRRLHTDKVQHIEITPEKLEEFSGVRKFRFGQSEAEDQTGVVTGLAWTETGGDLLTIEAVSMIGKGKMTVTGNLRDVMKESVSAAHAYVQSRAPSFGIHPERFAKTDIHVHVPEGATPKDGPSAGIAMVSAIVSVLTGIAVRKDVAMTGEVTLRGRVLPIGGLKEKLLAALRGGIKTVLIPEENKKDLAEIPENVKKGLTIHAVKTVDEVLDRALVDMPEPLPWPGEEVVQTSGPEPSKETGALMRH